MTFDIHEGESRQDRPLKAAHLDNTSFEAEAGRFVK